MTVQLPEGFTWVSKVDQQEPKPQSTPAISRPPLPEGYKWTDQAPEPPSFTGAFSRGLKRTLPETKGLLAGAGAALAGAVGADGVRDSLLNTYQDIQKNEVAPLANQSGFMDSVTGDGSLKEWAGDTLGNFAGQALQSIAAGTAGAVIGSAVPGAGTVAGGVGGLLARTGAKDLVEGEVARMVAKGVAEDVAQKAVLRRLGGAAVAGTGLNVGQEVGTAFTGRADDAAAAGEQLNQTDALRAIGYGVPAGLVDTAAEALTGSRLIEGVSDSPKLLRRVAKGAGIGAVSEGGTEGVQAVLERAGANQQLTGDQAYADYIENVAAGALGGGVAGAGGGLRRKAIDQPPAPPPAAEPSPPAEVLASQQQPAIAEPQQPPTITRPPAGPVATAAQTAVATGAAQAVAGAQPAPTQQENNGPLTTPPEAAVIPPPAAAPDPVFEQAKQLLADAGKVDRGALAAALNINGKQTNALLDKLQAAGIISAKDGKKPRTLLINPVTGELLDQSEAAKLDRKAKAKEQQKALEASVREGTSAAVAAAANAQGQQPTPPPGGLATPPDPAAFQAKMEAKRTAALTRPPRPDPAAGAVSAAAATAFDTGAHDAAREQQAQIDAEQAAQAEAQAQKAQQAEAERAQREQTKAAAEAKRLQDQATKEAEKAALQTSDADIQAAVQAEIDAGKPMDGMRLIALAKRLNVTPKRVDQMRVALAKARKARAATKTTTDSLPVASTPETPAPPISQSTPGAVQTQRAAPVAQPQASAGPLAAQPESKSEPNPTSYDTSAEVLDSDITSPSGSAFSIRAAAELQAKRTPGGKVFEVDGGFVVRTPRAGDVSTKAPETNTSAQAVKESTGSDPTAAVYAAKDRDSYVAAVHALVQSLPDGSTVTDGETGLTYAVKHSVNEKTGARHVEFGVVGGKGENDVTFTTKADGSVKVSGDVYFPGKGRATIVPASAERVTPATVKESLTVAAAKPKAELAAEDPGLEDALRQERDAYTNERDDAYLNKTKHARDPLKDAVEDAVNASVLDPDAARVVLDVALSNGRVDLAEYAVSRAERAVAGMSVTPGVPQNSPKYADIKAALESRKREATALLDSLKKDLAAAKTATVRESLTVGTVAAENEQQERERADNEQQVAMPELSAHLESGQLPTINSEMADGKTVWTATAVKSTDKKHYLRLDPTKEERKAATVAESDIALADTQEEREAAKLALRQALLPATKRAVERAKAARAALTQAQPAAQETTNAKQEAPRTEQAAAAWQAAAEPAKPKRGTERKLMPRSDAIGEVKRQLGVTKKRAEEIVGAIKSEAKNLDGVTYNLKPGIVQTADVMAAIERERTPAPTPAPENASAAVATHVEPGQPPEPVTAPVIADAIKTSAAKTPLNLKEARAWLLERVDEALKGAVAQVEAWAKAEIKPEYDRETKGIKLSKEEAEAVGFVTFDVPGDGKFKVLNTREGLQAFRAKVAASSGFKDERKASTRPSMPKSEAWTVINDFLEDDEHGNMFTYANAVDKPLRFGEGGNGTVTAYAVAEDVQIADGIKAFVGRAAYRGQLKQEKGKPLSLRGMWAVIEVTTGQSVSGFWPNRDAAIAASKRNIEKAGVGVLRDKIAKTAARTEKQREQDWLKAAAPDVLALLNGEPEVEQAAKPKAPVKVESAKPADTQEKAELGLMKDGIAGREVPWQNVPNGNDAFQYAIGRTEQDGQDAIYRRKASERGTYGGWRWEGNVPAAESTKPADPEKNEVDARYEHLLSLKGTRLMDKHSDGRALYEVSLSLEQRKKLQDSRGHFIRSDNFELKTKEAVTGNKYATGYVLIDRREQNANRAVRYENAKAGTKPVTPQMASANRLQTLISIAADSVDKLRKADVERVIREAPAEYRQILSEYIKTNRQDLAGEVDDVMAEEALRRGDFEAEDRMRKQQRAEKLRAAGDMSNGGTLRQGASERWAMVIPNMSEEGGWRIQRFDKQGFSGHMVFKTMDEAVNEAVQEGYTVRDDEALPRIQDDAAFKRGNHVSSLIYQLNAKQITTADFEKAVAEYDKSVEPAKAAEIPEGYKPTGEPYYVGKDLVQGYAKFPQGERVKLASGIQGVVTGHIGKGPILTRAMVKFDNGTESGVDERELSAVAPAAVPAADEQPEVLSEKDARAKLEWRNLGQKDNVKTHAVFFDGMRFGTINGFDGRWEAEDADISMHDSLRSAKQAVEDVAIEKLREQGYVEKRTAAELQAQAKDLRERAKTAATADERAQLSTLYRETEDAVTAAMERETAELAARDEKANKKHSVAITAVSTPAGALKADAYNSRASSSVWWHQGDVNMIQFNAKAVLGDSSSDRAREDQEKAKTEWARIKAARAAGWGLTNVRAGSYGTVWVFEKKGEYLTRAGFENIDNSVFARPDMPANEAGYESMARRQITFAKAFMDWANTLPEDQRNNLSVLSRKINETPIHTWARIQEDSNNEKMLMLNEGSGWSTRIGLGIDADWPQSMRFLNAIASKAADIGKRDGYVLLREAKTESGVVLDVAEKGRLGREKAATAAAAPKAAAEPKDRVEGFKQAVRALHEGTLSVEDYRAAYDALRKGALEVRADLAKLSKDELRNTFGIMRDGKKSELVDMAYESMVNTFALRKEFGPRSYMMVRGGFEDYQAKRAAALDELVQGQTAESLAEFAEQERSAREGRQKQRTEMVEAVKNPKTLADFRAFMRYQEGEGKTFEQARMTLTLEQRVLFDELNAAEFRAQRKSAAEPVQAVKVAGQKVSAQVIATKHTQKGHDLYVVQLGERVPREDYDTLNATAKRLGGSWSSYNKGGAVPGFQFRERQSAEAFVKLANGDASAAQAAVDARRDAFQDDRSQTGVERLREMADRLEERADESLSRDRKSNTDRRARMAASAEASANADKALARTMRNIADAIDNGSAKFLDRVRQKVQVETLASYVAGAKSNELRAKYPYYGDYERHQGEPPTQETADFADFPRYTMYRSDLAALGRQLLNVDGTKQLGQRLMKVADDVSDAFTAWAKEPGNLFRLSTFGMRAGEDVRAAIFPSADAAERAIKRSGLVGKAIAFQEKRGVHRVIMSPSQAIAAGIWKGDGDKRIHLNPEFGAELVEAIGKTARRGAKVAVPWQLETAYDRRKFLSRMGIETPAEFRAALREFIGLRQQPAAADRVKELERSMIGRAKDGLDFFPTPSAIADEMIAAAGIEHGMTVLEPSAGMGHIAERIRESGVEPGVVEFSSARRELLEAKGFNVVGRDFMDLSAPHDPVTIAELEAARDIARGEARSMMDGAIASMNAGDLAGASALAHRAARTTFYTDFHQVLHPLLARMDGGYDRIVMNPPFSDGRDVQHVQHAYSLLKPGGRLVALMGESAFVNQNKRATEFRDWLESVGGTEEKLPEGSFMDPSLPVNTSANARMVVIDKPEARASFAKDADAPKFSPATARAWQALADIPGTFQRPRTDAKSFEDITKTILPDAEVVEVEDGATITVQPQKDDDGNVARDMGTTLVRVEYVRTSGGVGVAPTDIGRGTLVGYTKDGKEVFSTPVNGRADVVTQFGPEIAARLLAQEGKAGRSAGLNTHVRTLTGVEVHPLGQPKAVTMTVLDGELAMDASQLQEGVHRGSALYSIALAYAHNNGITFIPDPADVSEAAMQRRGEHMLSSALKTGTTRHMVPHEDQGLDWIVGDDQHNLLELIRASADNVIDKVPDLQAVDYDWDSGQFIAADGRAFTRDDFKALAESPAGRAARAGVSTLRRGVVSRSLERRAGTPAWRGVVTRLLQLGRAGLRGSQLEAILYGRDATNARPGLTKAKLEGVFKAAIAGMRAAGIDVRIAENGDDLARQAPEIVGQDDYDDTVQAAITADRKTVWFVASRIKGVRQAIKLFAHELVGHMSMEQLLGKRWPELRDAILRLHDNGKWPEVFAEVSRRYERNADGTFRALDDATFAAEAIAVFAERNIQTSILQRAVNAVRAWLRRLGFAMDMSQGELRQMLWEAGQKLEGRAYRPGVVDDVLGAKPEPGQMSRREAVERHSFSRTTDRDPFYSALLRSIEEAKGAPKKADGATWRQWLDGAQRRGEIKQSEREWVGVDAWLDGQKEPVTREALAEFVRANAVQVREVVLGEQSARLAQLQKEFEDRGFGFATVYGREDDSGDEFQNIAFTDDDGNEIDFRELPKDLQQKYRSASDYKDNAKFGSYQLPGGQNYRELLLTMPDASVETDSTGRFRVRFFDETGRDRVEHATMPQVEAFRRRGNRAEVLGPVVYKNASKNYTSSHFDQPNILAHVRFNERTDADGKRVLFVEEVQSDWHQEGRKKGYGGQQSAQRRKQIQSRMAVLAEVLDDSLPDDGPQARAEYDRLAAELRTLPITDGVPDAPLKKEWPLTAMKRMIRWAAENGFDRVAWTTGNQQAERYDLSKQVDKITVYGRTNAETRERTRTVTIDLADHGGAITLGVDKNGVIDNQRAGAGDFVGKSLADVVGKEMADKIMGAELGLGGRAFTGNDLKLGGEGMRAFYDKMLPGELAKYVKRWGGKVGTTAMAGSSTVRRYSDSVWHVIRDGQIIASKNSEEQARSTAAAANRRDQVGSDQPSIDITPAMRQAAMEGQALFAKGGEPTMVDRLQELINPKDTTLLERIKNKLADWRPAALGALQLRHLGELAEDILPPVANYSQVVQRMATMRNELQELGHDVVDAGMKYQGNNPKEAKTLFRLLHDATLAGVDPAEAHQPLRMMAADYRSNVEVTPKNVRDFVTMMKEQAKLNPGSAVTYVNRAKEARKMLKQEARRAQSHREMAPRFARLSPEAKALWVQMRDAYRTQSAEYEKALISRIESLAFDKAQKAGQIAKMRLMFESARVPFYVPLARWGEFWVSGTNAEGQREFYMQESSEAQARVRKELAAQGYTDIGHGVKLDTVKAQDGASASFMADMDEMLKQANAPAKIRDEAFQLYLRSLPDLSIRQNFIHRQGTPGYSQDALRALAGHIFHGSFQIARLRYSHELEAIRTEAEDMARDMGKAGDAEANAAGNIVNELKKRHEWVMNPQDNPLVNKISSVGFVYYLGLTPAAALVNLLQTPMVALPVLAGKHKLADVTRELWRAMKQSLGTYGHMQKLLTGDELAAHTEFGKRGVFDKTQSANLAGISESDTHAYSPRWHKTMSVISHLFHKGEVVNREATAMAAYRLERASGAGHIEAIEAADRAVHESHFDYSNANRARYMQSGPAKVLLMFRQYGLAVTWLLGRNLWQSLKGLDPATRTEARRKLAGILGMTAMFSGTLGLPMLGTVGGVLNALAAAFGSDDEPWDWETEFRAFLRDMLGDAGAEVVLRGPVQAATGVGIASRVSMSDLWFREPDRELEGRAWSNYLFEQAAGPMGGLVTNFFRGQQLMGEGQVWRGVETIMPKAIKDAMKSIRYLDEGVNNLRGDAIVDDLNVFESLAQISGFSPASVSTAYDTARDIKNYEQHILDRRSRLMDAFALAWRLGDVDAREAVLGKMRKFSATYPELAITGETIKRSLTARARASAQADGGVIVDKRIRARLQAQLGQ